jgi:hypothetical protein
LHVRDERSVEVLVVAVGPSDSCLEQLKLTVEWRLALGRRHRPQVLERGA